MLFIPIVDKESTQRAFAEAETLLVLDICPSKVSLFLAAQIFQQMNLGRASHALVKFSFWMREP